MIQGIGYASRQVWEGRVAAEQPRRRYGRSSPFSSAEAIDPRTLRPADCIYRVDAEGRRREATVTRVFEAAGALRFNALWDEPDPNDPEPWRGASHGLKVDVLRQAGWGVVVQRSSFGDWTRARKLLFSLGRVVATPGALDMLTQVGERPLGYVLRHQTGDWGDLDAHDLTANENAILEGDRILSAYVLHAGERLWILTEADRSATTLLLPDEY